MGIGLEELLEELDKFEETFYYFLVCSGKAEDKREWEVRFQVMRGHILDAYEKE
jgi:hypothetical protein